MKDSLSRKIFVVCNTLFMILLCVVTIYPILYVVFASFSDPVSLMAHSGILYKPLGFSLEAYSRALVHPLIMSGYINTLFILVAGVVISLVLTAIGAFFLTRQNVMLQRPIGLLILFTMFFNGGMIPFYFAVRDVGLYNSTWSLILPTAINTFNLMVMKAGFEALPASLEESAKIDGAGHLTVLFRIVIPLALPTVAVMILYYGVSYWNSWFYASIFLQDDAKWPLQLVARQILIVNDSGGTTSGVDSGAQLAISETIKYAVIVITSLPIIAAFMPLLVGLGGNIGTQSITLMVRGMSTGQVTLSSGWSHIGRETITGLCIGFIFGMCVTFATWGWQQNAELGFVIGLAMALNMTLAAIIGTCTPLFLKKLKIDPAVASGPLITTAIDIIGLAVYLTLVTWYLINT